MAVLVFEGLITSSEPILAWSQGTAIALEGRMMRIKVSTTRCGVSSGIQMVGEWSTSIFIILILIAKKGPININNHLIPLCR